MNSSSSKFKRKSNVSSTTPKIAMMGRTEEEEGFFDLILKLQGGARIEDQRSSGPRIGGNFVEKRRESFDTPPPPPSPPPSAPSVEVTSRPDTIIDEPLYENPDALQDDDYACPRMSYDNRGSINDAFSPPPNVANEIRRSHSLASSGDRKLSAQSSTSNDRRVSSMSAGSFSPQTPPRPSLKKRTLDRIAEPSTSSGVESESSRKPSASDEELELLEQAWYTGKTDRKKAESLLQHWPNGAFLVRKGRSSRVMTLKFPIAKDKTFFHVKIEYDGSMYSVTETECFRGIPELIAFYVENPSKFFRGMTPEERTKYRLLPYRPLPVLKLEQMPMQEASEV